MKRNQKGHRRTIGKKHDWEWCADILSYDRLRLAIVYIAIMDYLQALEYNESAEIKALERFFRSNWGQFLSGDMGEYIIKQARKKARRNSG